MWIYVLPVLWGILVFYGAVTLAFRYFYVPVAVADGTESAGSPGAAPVARGSRERRLSHRFASVGDAIVSWQTDNECAVSARGAILNLSESGLAFKSNLDLVPGMYVYVQVPHLQSAATGNVRHSRASGRRWIVGIEFRGTLFPK